MLKDTIAVKDLRLAKMRYYEADKGGCEIPEIDAYALFAKVGDKWMNVFRPLTDCNVYDRLPYSNSTQSGESYGSKISLVNGKEEDGLCYILEPAQKEMFGHTNRISIREICEAMCKDLDTFFFDRWNLCFHEEGYTSTKDKYNVLKFDTRRRKELAKYFATKQPKGKSIIKIKSMRNEVVATKDLREAKIRYYETDMNGCEVPELDAYTVFTKVGDKWVNLFHPLVDCNVYERVPYSNSTLDGENHGTKIQLANGKEEDGICYVLEKATDRFYGGYGKVQVGYFVRDIISCNMHIYFIDRWDFCFSESGFISLAEESEIERIDGLKREIFKEYMESKRSEIEDKKVYQKEQN